MGTVLFEEVSASESGILSQGLSYGSAWGDVNGDSYPDLWVNGHFDDSALYLNNGDGTFTNATAAIFAEPPSGDAHGTAWADFDGDGDQDLIQLVGAARGLGTFPGLAHRFYVNEGGILEDQAELRGIDYPADRGRSPLWFDFNNDGLLDLAVGTNARADEIEAPPKILQQNADGTFVDVSEAVGFDQDNSEFFFLSDLSGDGNLDLVARTVPPFTIYDTTSIPFRDITSEVLPNATRKEVATADFNGDLRPDLYISNSFDGRNDVYVHENDPNRLTAKLRAVEDEKGFQFDTDAEVTFNLFDGGVRFAIPPDKIYIGAEGLNPTDLTFTLSPDNPEVEGILPHTPGVDRGIYIGYDPSLQRWQFLLSSTNEIIPEENVINQELMAVSIQSSATISELTAIGFQAPPPNLNDQLWMSTPQGYVNQGNAAGINSIPIQEGNPITGDFDNDMDQDLYIVTSRSAINTPNVLYENQGDGTFIAVPDAGGAAGTEIGQGDFAISADYDLDGFLDLFVGNGAGLDTPLVDIAPYQLFRNQGNENHWFQIDLQGTVSNRDGIGAQVFLTAGGVTQLREQAGGIVNNTQSHQRVHFGLAEHTEVEELVINWPSGRTQRIENLPADRLLQVIEIGGDTRDRITGSPKNEVISGGGGKDILQGRGGNDYLYGDNGKDWLVGGPGRDVLSGGNGADTFVLQQGRGLDIIADFQDGQDVFKLRSRLTFEQLSIAQVNNDTQITIVNSGEVLATVLDTNASVIGAEDFR